MVTVPDADAERAERIRAERSARSVLRCGCCGGAVTVVVTVENCGRRRAPLEEAEPERLEADDRCREPGEEARREDLDAFIARALRGSRTAALTARSAER